MHKLKNLVMGFATNLEAQRMEVFCRSLRDVYSADECDVVICTNTRDEPLWSMLDHLDVKLVYTCNNYSSEISKFSKLLNRAMIYPSKWMSKFSASSKHLRPIFTDLYPQLIQLWHHPHMVRWLVYKDVLAHCYPYHRVFLADVKDVAFQDRFFDGLSEPALHLFQQDQQFGPDNYDSRWYRDAYGQAALEKVVGEEAYCIGTVAGDLSSLRYFVDKVCEEVLRRPFGRIEQTILHKLMYVDGLGCDIVHHPNRDDVVLTLTCEKTWDYYDVTDRGICWKDGRKVPVIHMYDREAKAAEYFLTTILNSPRPGTL